MLALNIAQNQSDGMAVITAAELKLGANQRAGAIKRH